MKQEVRLFNGDFNKKKKYISYKDSQKMGYNIIFDDQLYEKVSSEICSTLGAKRKYGIFDAMEYFQIKYLAYRIPWKYMLYYTEPKAYCCDYLRDDYISFHESFLAPDETAPFNYEEEKNITLVIDTYYNKLLREKYPTIMQLEAFYENVQKKEDISSKDVIVSRDTNPIIVIGTLDNYKINSMVCVSGSTNVLSAIPDIDYEIWYFHEHS